MCACARVCVCACMRANVCCGCGGGRRCVNARALSLVVCRLCLCTPLLPAVMVFEQPGELDAAGLSAASAAIRTRAGFSAAGFAGEHGLTPLGGNLFKARN